MIDVDIKSLLYQFDGLKTGVEAINSQKMTATFKETNMISFVKILESIRLMLETLELLKTTLNRDIYKGIEAIKQIDIELSQKMVVSGGDGDTCASYETYEGFDIRGNHSSVRSNGE